MLSLLPAIVEPDRVALVGLHSWTEDDYPNNTKWGIRSFSLDDLRQSSQSAQPPAELPGLAVVHPPRDQDRRRPARVVS